VTLNDRDTEADQDGVTRTHPQVSFALGEIESSPAPVYGAVQLLDDDSYALWPYANGQITGPFAYIPTPTGTRVCGGHVLVGDINADGADDIIQYGNRCGGGDSGFEVWTGGAGTPPANFTYQGYVSVGPGLQSMQIGDLDGDGHDDLAFTFASSLASGDGAYAAALYDPGLTLANQPALHFGFQPSNDSSADLHTLTGGAGALQIGDVAAPANPSADTDGHPDLVIAQPQSGQIVVLANDPSSPGTSFAPYGTPTRFGDGTAVANGPDGLTLGRIDADGRLDMVAWATRPAAADWEVYTATRPPAVVLSTSATKAFAGAPVTFTATATAPAGSPEDATLDHVDWDFDGDGTVDQTTTTPTVAHAFTTTGIYQVVLRVTDGDGVVATVTRPVGVAAVLTADLRIVPAQPAPGQAVSFDATTTVGGTRPYTYAWTLDGSLLGGPGDGADQIQRTFATPGHHTIARGVTDGAGHSSVVAARSFKVAAPVVAAFATRPALPETGEQVSFDAGQSTGGIAPLRYAWDLDGDGSYEDDTGRPRPIGSRSRLTASTPSACA
jgi:PKD repeat protein